MDKKNILVVEDEAPLRDVLKSKLEEEGFSVSTAVNGVEGLMAVQKEKPDLILLDILMPIMDGVTMLKELRIYEENRNIPVIVLTNLFDEKKVTECMEKGVYDYLVKIDWKIEDVVTLVKSKLETK
jgi:CheY-like chemotaxis protein